jgi:hypothetical protein
LGDGNKALINKRKQLVDALIYQWDSPNNLRLLDDDLLKMIMDELSQAQDGKLEAFAPILQNILREFLQHRSNNKGLPLHAATINC